MLENRTNHKVTTSGTATLTLTLGGAVEGYAGFALVPLNVSRPIVVVDGHNYMIGYGNKTSTSSFQITSLEETLYSGSLDTSEPAPIPLSGNAQIFVCDHAQYKASITPSSVFITGDYTVSANQVVIVGAPVSPVTITAPVAASLASFDVIDGPKVSENTVINITFGAASFEGESQDFQINQNGFAARFIYIIDTWRVFKIG